MWSPGHSDNVQSAWPHPDMLLAEYHLHLLDRAVADQAENSQFATDGLGTGYILPQARLPGPVVTGSETFLDLRAHPTINVSPDRYPNH